jgi:hypothetical protein
MSRFRRCALAGCALLVLSGCTSYRGTDRIYRQVTYQGKVTKEGQRGTPGLLGLSHTFATDIRAAYAARNAAGGYSEAQIEALNLSMLKSGMALVRANCIEYFHEMGRHHRSSRVLRDLVTPISNVLTGLVAMHIFSDAEVTNTNILKALAIGSGAYTAALDIYDTRFLFGSDNIADVQTMVVTALGNHQTSLEARPPNDFVFVVTHLLDNENICTPPQILTLVRESIRTANPKPKDEDGDGGDDDADNGADEGPEPSPNVARPVSVEPGG